MIEAMHDSVKAIEEKMSAAFTKIDDRLEKKSANGQLLFFGEHIL